MALSKEQTRILYPEEMEKEKDELIKEISSIIQPYMDKFNDFARQNCSCQCKLFKFDITSTPVENTDDIEIAKDFWVIHNQVKKYNSSLNIGVRFELTYSQDAGNSAYLFGRHYDDIRYKFGLLEEKLQERIKNSIVNIILESPVFVDEKNVGMTNHSNTYSTGIIAYIHRDLDVEELIELYDNFKTLNKIQK